MSARNTRFELSIPERLDTTVAPTDEEIELLSGENDPTGIVIGK